MSASTDIHPSAIVDAGARLHPGVKVGPGAIIEADVEIGEGTIVGPRAHVHEGTRMGKNNVIADGAILGAIPQHLMWDGTSKTGLLIGDGNTFREYCNIHRGYKPDSNTIIGNRNYFMGGVHIAHDCEIESDNIFTHGCMVAGHVHIGNRIFISALVGVHQFCRIGNFAMIGGCSKVVMDVPPFSMVDGNPAWIRGLNTVGMRRAGIEKDRLRAIINAYRVVHQSGLSDSEALARLRAEDPTDDVKYLIAFYEGTERGILGYSPVDEEGI